MSPCNNCSAPESTTNIYNYSLASSQVHQESHLVVIDTFTTDEIPGDGGMFMVFIDGVMQLLDTDYTVDFTTGVVTFADATFAGLTAVVVYVEA